VRRGLETWREAQLGGRAIGKVVRLKPRVLPATGEEEPLPAKVG
jgi:hypothetical protein